jgi:hypothetical protein
MGILMTIILLSFGENLEIEAYMLWPGLVLLGVHLREMASENVHRVETQAETLPDPRSGDILT